MPFRFAKMVIFLLIVMIAGALFCETAMAEVVGRPKATVAAAFSPNVRFLFEKNAIAVYGSYSSRTFPAEIWVEVTLADSSRKVVRSGKLHLIENRCIADVIWPAKDLGRSQYTIVFTEISTGKELAKAPWTKPEMPPWLGSKVGRFDDNYVLKPWTAVKVNQADGLSVQCWGRKYSFSQSGLIDSIVSRDSEVLAAPMEIDAVVGGQNVTWTAEKIKVIKAAKGAVEFVARQEGNGLLMTCSGRMEFDGFVKLDIDLCGSDDSIVIDSLILRVPYKKDLARLIHHYPKVPVWEKTDMKDFNSGAAPDKPWKSVFLPHIWMGDQERGLQWLCESARNWRPADENKAIEIIPSDGSELLQLNLIGKPTRLRDHLKYTFSFEASPIKPMPVDYHYWGYSQTANYGIEYAPSYHPTGGVSITYPAAGNIDASQGTLEMEITPRFDSAKADQPIKNLFNLIWPEDMQDMPANIAGFYWSMEDRGMRFVTREFNKYTRNRGGVRMPWKAGQTHTIAFTWGKDEGVFFDARKLLESPGRPLFLNVDLSKAIIQIGGAGSEFIIKRIRISDVSRPASELMKAGVRIQPDTHTLLMDSFAAVASSQTSPAKSANMIGGKISGDYQPAQRGIDLLGTHSRDVRLDDFKNIGMHFLGFNQEWADWEGYPDTSQTAELRSLIGAIHKADMGIILYSSMAIANTAPEYAVYYPECGQMASNSIATEQKPQRKVFEMCPRSVWSDFLVDGWKKTFDKYHADGLYTDGLTSIAECSNRLHGCGYFGDDGKVHSTYAIYQIRDLMKRIAYVLEKQNRKTFWMAQTSGSVVLPAIGFADAYLDGEHLTNQPRPFRMSLDKFQAEFMGLNFGIPTQFLVYYWLNGFTTPEGLAISLLHDTELGWNERTMEPLWREWREFDVDKAQFVGYWKQQGWKMPDGVKISGYFKDNGDAIIIASNLSDVEVSGTLTLNAPILTAVDVLTGKSVSLVSGAIEDTFPVWQAKVYRVRLSK